VMRTLRIMGGPFERAERTPPELIPEE